MTRFKTWLIVVCATILVGGVFSCNDSIVFAENQGMEGNVWKSDDVKTFKVDVTDTISPLNIFVNLRTTVDYPYSNIYVFLYSEFPDGTSDKDTLEFLLAKSDGEWLGENSGTIVEFKGLIASGGRFSVSGEYIFKMQHAMREDELGEIVDIGIKIETIED